MSAWESEDNTVLVDSRDGVAVVRFNRPERQNAWTPTMGDAYFAVLREMARAEEVRAIVVTGTGRSFCAGADAAALGKFASGAEFKPDPKRESHWFPLRIGKPVIAAVNGACAGIGLQQALCADVRFAGAGARFTTAYARRGLIGEVGITWLLPRLVGTGHAADLLLSARAVDAAEALSIGLVSRVVPDEQLVETAVAYARDLARNCSPRSMGILKRQLHSDLSRDLPAAYAAAKSLLPAAFAAADVREGVTSWMEKRPPSFPALAPELAVVEEAAYRWGHDG